MKSNEQEFNENLEKLGSLYEEGKDCLHKTLNISKEHRRLYDILREMRDLAAVQLQKIHFVNEN